MPQDESDDPNINSFKKSIENIIGAKTSLKRRRKTAEDLKKEAFIKLINDIEKTLNRSEVAKQFVDLSNYDEAFYQIIDNMIIFMFGEDGAKVILWYLYGRYNDDGTFAKLLDDKDKVIPLENPGDLWKLVEAQIKPKNTDKKR
jgi:hypothetical protein